MGLCLIEGCLPDGGVSAWQGGLPGERLVEGCLLGGRCLPGRGVCLAGGSLPGGEWVSAWWRGVCLMEGCLPGREVCRGNVYMAGVSAWCLRATKYLTHTGQERLIRTRLIRSST